MILLKYYKNNMIYYYIWKLICNNIYLNPMNYS